MLPMIESTDAFWVLGVPAHGVPKTFDYQQIWDTQFMSVHEQLLAVSTDGQYYGVYFDSDEPGKVDFIAGMAVSPGTEVPAGLQARELPAATYAVFDGTMSTIGSTWDEIMSRWLPQSPYEYDGSKVSFEFFASDMGEGPDAPMMIYVPVTGG